MDKKTFLQRYKGLKFIIKEPVLDIGGGDGTFLECNDVKKATIIDLTEKQNSKYIYTSRYFKETSRVKTKI